MMTESFLPSMRALVARRLSEEGNSQGKISRLLGITQASVSNYLSSDLHEVYSKLSSIGITPEEGERYGSLLAEDVKKNPVYAVSTLYSIWSNLLGKGVLCGFHREGYPFLAECDVCVKMFGPSRSLPIGGRGGGSRAVALLESSRSFVLIMPEVSVNIAYAEGEASSPEQVIAIPGRIVKVGSYARSLSRPEYGASSHLARVLIQVRARRKDVRTAMNLRFDSRVAAVIRRLGLKTLRTGGDYPMRGEDPIVEGMKSRIATAKEYDAIVDTGGLGVEPSLYLLGSDPVKLAELAIKVSREYSAKLVS